MLSLLRILPSVCGKNQNELVPNDFDSASIILRRYGIVVIPREIILKEIDLDLYKVEKKIGELQDLFIDNEYFINKNIPILNETTLKQHTSLFARQGKSFLHIRNEVFFDIYRRKWRDIDTNMYDYYNPDSSILNDFYIDEYLNKVKEMTQTIISSIFKSKTIVSPYSNIYIYRKVTSPRCLHVDTHRKQFKVFTSLSDVTSIEDGPISYVPRSNKMRGRLRSIFSSFISTFLFSDIGNNKNDAVLYGRQESLPILTRPLDVVIGNQSCVHGDCKYVGNDNKLQKIIHVYNFFAK